MFSTNEETYYLEELERLIPSLRDNLVYTGKRSKEEFIYKSSLFSELVIHYTPKQVRSLKKDIPHKVYMFWNGEQIKGTDSSEYTSLYLENEFLFNQDEELLFKALANNRINTQNIQGVKKYFLSNLQEFFQEEITTKYSCTVTYQDEISVLYLNITLPSKDVIRIEQRKADNSHNTIFSIQFSMFHSKHIIHYSPRTGKCSLRKDDRYSITLSMEEIFDTYYSASLQMNNTLIQEDTIPKMEALKKSSMLFQLASVRISV